MLEAGVFLLCKIKGEKIMRKSIVNVGRANEGKQGFGKRYSLITVLVVVILTLVACGKSQASSSMDLDQINKRGYIIMGLDDTFAPMGFRNTGGELVGFDIDLAKEVFKRANIEVRFQPIEWAMKETELNTGNIDLIWNGYSITEERKEKVIFTKPYLENKQIIVTLSDSKIENKEDLKNKKVAVQNGSSAMDAVMRESDVVEEFEGGEPLLFDTNNEAFMDLEAGRSDAVVADEVLARYYVKQKGDEKYRILTEDFGKEEYGIGIRNTNKDILKLLDDIIDEMRSDGSYDEIYSKWFSEN